MCMVHLLPDGISPLLCVLEAPPCRCESQLVLQLGDGCRLSLRHSGEGRERPLRRDRAEQVVSQLFVGRGRRRGAQCV